MRQAILAMVCTLQVIAFPCPCAAWDNPAASGSDWSNPAAGDGGWVNPAAPAASSGAAPSVNTPSAASDAKKAGSPAASGSSASRSAAATSADTEESSRAVRRLQRDASAGRIAAGAAGVVSGAVREEAYGRRGKASGIAMEATGLTDEQIIARETERSIKLSLFLTGSVGMNARDYGLELRKAGYALRGQCAKGEIYASTNSTPPVLVFLRGGAVMSSRTYKGPADKEGLECIANAAWMREDGPAPSMFGLRMGMTPELAGLAMLSRGLKAAGGSNVAKYVSGSTVMECEFSKEGLSAWRLRCGQTPPPALAVDMAALSGGRRAWLYNDADIAVSGCAGGICSEVMARRH